MKRLRIVLNSLSTKVFIAIFLMILPINLIALFSTDRAVQKSIEQVCLAKQDIVNIRMADLEKKMDSSTSLLSYIIANDADAVTMFRQSETGAKYQLAKMRFFSKLRSNVRMINGADGYFFYMQEAQDWLQYGSKQEKADIQSLMPEIVENGLRGWALYDTSDGIQYLIYSFMQGKVLYGAWFRTDTILKQAKNAIAYEHTTLQFQKDPVESDYKNYQIAAGTGKLFWKVTLDYKEIVQELKIYPSLFRISVLLFLFDAPVLYWLIRRLILIPMDIVRKAHHEMQSGNQDYRISEGGNSVEMRNIYQSFNSMADDLQKYKFAAYEQELARRDMEIMNLQLQIRPHFLLNMFNLLYTLLLQGNFEDLQNIILYLSNYFRYIFREGKERAIFSKEFDMIRQYVEVAAIRYRGRVEADYEIDPQVMSVRVPPLLIHNFVENAIKHGIKEQGVLHIFLAGEYEDEMVRFTILDDGNGMDEETLEANRKILRGEYESKTPEAHLGLYNSYRRLRYAYGDSVTVTLHSEHQKGTRYTIMFRYVL